ncbi:hypothetical protein GCM10009091_37180 [Pseudomonas brenneri]|nr:hypothetical protein GCM10009091_37180 [Pseudomonas brenneri]
MLRQLFLPRTVAVCGNKVASRFTAINSTHLGNNVTKDELRAELERQEQRYKDVYGGEVTTYAAQPEPERKPWRKRASLLDQAFAQEIQKIEKDLKAEEP